MGDSYFARVSSSTQSLFNLHAKKVEATCINGFCSASDRDRYVTAFSVNWEDLPQSEKAGHSLSNCVACATQFERLQKMFPLKPTFLCPSEDANASVCIDRLMRFAVRILVNLLLSFQQTLATNHRLK